MINEKQLRQLLEQKNANERKSLAYIQKLKRELEEAECNYTELLEAFSELYNENDWLLEAFDDFR